ncbi:hypothetical protein [Nocardiopsis suaedae]|uniref:Uncharacterized protein n=1 Tax=Nocardiopsis suaedae TaxID=3018444 RepID=A0ABT4TGC7_9ACTN|nr:hypothetical protein [Nocardiopsis suaedae]MDA2803770.1 hypothetical protein [Nocardiopsis suaedae]
MSQVAFIVGLALADPMLFKLRSRSAIGHKAEADAYHALRREWRIREKLEYAHTLGYASERKYRKLHEFTSSIRDDLVDGVKRIDSTKVMHMQQLRNRYYQYIRDPIRKLDTESRKIDHFLKKNGIDPASPEHPWNREKRYQETTDGHSDR